MRKRTNNEKIIEDTKIRYFYQYWSESKIAKKLHVSKSDVSKALRNKKFEKIKLERFYKSQMHALPKKSAGTNNKDTVNNVAKNNNIISSKSNSKSTEFNSAKSKITNQIKKVPVENKSEVSKSTSNPSNNVVNKRIVNSPKLNSSATSYQPTQNELTDKSKPSNKAKKVPSKSELEISKQYQTSSASSATKSVNHSKKNQFMPYMSKKDRQEEQDLEATIDPHEIDYFSLRQLMTLYLDNAHQQFITNHWDCLYKRLSQYYTQKILIRAKALNIIFKKKMKTKERAEKKTKKFLNGLFNK